MVERERLRELVSRMLQAPVPPEEVEDVVRGLVRIGALGAAELGVEVLRSFPQVAPLVGSGRIARILGVRDVTIRQWRRRPWVRFPAPVAADGRRLWWSLDEVLAWRLRRGTPGPGKPRGSRRP
ncbi:MAG: hypothetical protein KatS3mg014_2514 [Actinomycetota bacterium]|nr:MAG: hypothetical protein KatS3mg014_2491 [Actinomycetota bacterium]GIV00899.1 MAG: hypothetical protein KatS3mg014_2514 [Actinomycetota bacterium]